MSENEIELSDQDVKDLAKMNAEGTVLEQIAGPIEGVVLREHDEDHDNCWCNKKYPLMAHGYQCGVAVPLANGDYSLQLDDNNVGRLVQTFINMGAMNSFSIVDGVGILDLGEDDEPDQEDPED